MVQIVVSRTQALIDEALRVVVQGLNPKQKVTVCALLEEGKGAYTSSAMFTADHQGLVDVSKAPSQGGTYTGVSAMGLFWSMRLTPNTRRGTRLLKKDVTTPLVTKLAVYDGQLMVSDPRSLTVPPLATTKVSRLYKDPSVDRIEVNQDGVRGTLFIPRGNKHYPGVIDVFGSVGGIIEFRAALMASRGFITLAVGYIFYNENPAYTEELEYFEKAVDILLNHPRVLKGGVGMVGVSKGSDVALALSVVCPKVKAVVSIGGVPWNAGCPHTYKERVILPTGIVLSSAEDGQQTVDFKHGSYVPVMSEEGLLYEIHPENVPPECFIPVEETHAKLLLISGSDDPYSPDHTANIIPERLQRVGRGEACQVLRYTRAGHLIEPPYSHHARSSHSVTGLMLWGGYPKEHAAAQEDAWPRTLHFLRKNLSRLPTPKL